MFSALRITQNLCNIFSKYMMMKTRKDNNSEELDLDYTQI